MADDSTDIFEPTTEEQRQGSFLDRPGIRSALLQAGLQLLQPVPVGQSTGGAIANAIGSAGEAYRRSVGTRIAGRKQKESEVESESQAAYRDSLTGRKTGKGGLTATQRLSAQRADRKEWEKYLKDSAQSLLDSGTLGAGADLNSAMDFLTNDQNKAKTIDSFKRRRGVADEALGATHPQFTTEQLMNDAGPQMAQLKAKIAAGDPQALALVDRLKSSVADPENLDIYLGGLSE